MKKTLLFPPLASLVPAMCILMLGVALPFSGKAQSFNSYGKEFWTAFMKNETGDGLVPGDKRLLIQISSKYNTSGVVEIPGTVFSQAFIVNAGTVTTVEVPAMFGHVVSTEMVEKKGIHITAADTISVFANNLKQYTSDASVVYPQRSLGTDYFVMTYHPLYPFGASTYPAEFLVLATEDGTEVEITPSAPTLGGKPANAPFTVTLNKGEIYQVQSANDITGSRVRVIKSCKKIAVICGNVCADVPNTTPRTGYCDHLFEQIIPIHMWGTIYHTVPFATRKGDTFRVLAEQAGTVVTVNGGFPRTLAAGKFFEFILDKPGIIRANKPIAVGQFSNGSAYDNALADPFLIFLLPDQQSIDTIIFNTSSGAAVGGNILNHYLNVVMLTEHVPTVRLDGKAVGDKFQPYAGDPAFSWAQLVVDLDNLLPSSHSLYSKGGFNAYAYGYGSYDSYGYIAGGKMDHINPSVGFTMDPNPVCQGKEVQFTSTIKAASSSVDYSWEFGDGASSSDAHPKYSYNTSGTFNVKLRIKENIVACVGGGRKDSVTQAIEVKPVPKAAFSFERDSLTVQFTGTNANGVNKWHWDFGDRSTPSEEQNPSHTYVQEDQFWVTLIVWGPCGSDTLKYLLNVTLNGKPKDTVTAYTGFQETYGERVFPNPTSGKLFLAWDKAGQKVNIQVFDMLGRIVLEQAGITSIDPRVLDLTSLVKASEQSSFFVRFSYKEYNTSKVLPVYILR